MCDQQQERSFETSLFLSYTHKVGQDSGSSVVSCFHHYPCEGMTLKNKTFTAKNGFRWQFYSSYTSRGLALAGGFVEEKEFWEEQLLLITM